MQKSEPWIVCLQLWWWYLCGLFFFYVRKFLAYFKDLALSIYSCISHLPKFICLYTFFPMEQSPRLYLLWQLSQNNFPSSGNWAGTVSSSVSPPATEPEMSLHLSLLWQPSLNGLSYGNQVRMVSLPLWESNLMVCQLWCIHMI